VSISQGVATTQHPKLEAVERTASLQQAINDIDAEERGEIRSKPTTAQEALNIYRRNLEVQARDKGYQYAHNVRSNCKVIQELWTTLAQTA